jgi:predicted HicB family RNase H-like nuclease
MKIITYKGYSAKINFDGRDNIFWGKVIGIKDRITFEGETVGQLTEDFHNAVDHYLVDCKQEGRTPCLCQFLSAAFSTHKQATSFCTPFSLQDQQEPVS